MPARQTQATQNSLAQAIVSGLSSSQGRQGGQDTAQTPPNSPQEAAGGPSITQGIPQQVTPEEVMAIEQGGDPVALVKKLVGGDDDPQVDLILQELFSQLQGTLQGGPPQAPLNPGLGPISGRQARGLAFGNQATQGIINEQIRPGLNEFNQQSQQFQADVGNFRDALSGAGELARDKAAGQRQRGVTEAANVRFETGRQDTAARQGITDDLAERKFDLSRETEDRKALEGQQRADVQIERLGQAEERLRLMGEVVDLRLQLGTGAIDPVTRNKIAALRSSAEIAREAVQEIKAMGGDVGGFIEGRIPDFASSTNLKNLRSILAKATARMKNEIAGANFTASEREVLGPLFVEATMSPESQLIGLENIADSAISLGSALIQGLEDVGRQPEATRKIRAGFPVGRNEGDEVGRVDLDKPSSVKTSGGSNVVITTNPDGTIDIKVVE